jgi:3-(3-hydroxy-phenyl)propionate hydroxylase
VTGVEHVAVAIVGAGPVGVTAANLLGGYDVPTLVIDREPAVVDYPRAIGVDDEALRTFQAAGLVEDILRGTIQNVPLRFFGAAGRSLADIRPAAREHGWYKRNVFSQPRAEAALRRGLDRFAHVRLMLGAEVRELVQDAHGVTLSLAGGREVRADYVIAADGGRSPIRTQLGIPFEGSTHPRKWVVIDCANDPLDAPYTALHCDPRRPYVCAHMPDDYRRWEFMLFPGEDAEQMLAPDRVADLLRHHVAGPGAVEVIRARVYTHHSRMAARFVEGRVALAGDAAHLMPPWAGQGLNTGLRDATNLCWKLAAIVTGQAHPSLLSTYDLERRPHAQAMVDLSTTLGRILSPTRRPVAVARDWLLRAASVAPAVKRWTVEMRFKPAPFYRRGFVVAEVPGARPPTAGRMLAQPMVEAPDGARVRLDEVLGPWFAVLGFECDPLAELTAGELDTLERFRPRVVKVIESRAGERHRSRRCVARDTVVVEDVDNDLRPWFQARGRNVALVRPDRYVAAMTTPAGLGPALTQLAAFLHQPPSPPEESP